MATARKNVNVNRNGTIGSRLLAFLAKALPSKVNGQETAAVGTAVAEARDLIESGPFAVSGTIQFTASGVVGIDTTAPKPYGFKWNEMLAMALVYSGVTRDAARKMLACMVGFQRDYMAAQAAQATQPKSKAKIDPATITVHDVNFTHVDGCGETVPAAEVRRLALNAQQRLAEIEADGELFGQQLMLDRPQRGAVSFDAIEIQAIAIDVHALHALAALAEDEAKAA